MVTQATTPSASGEKLMDPKTWLTKVKERKEWFERKLWPDAKEAVRIYDGNSTVADSGADIPFNVLFANTEILLPNLYSSTPRPEVLLRPAGHPALAQITTNILTYLLDDNLPNGMESFDHVMEGVALSALVPGTGGVRLRLYPGEPCPVRWEEFKYDQLIWGQARKWSKVPWIAFIHPMTRSELETEFKLDNNDLRSFPDGQTEGKDPTFDVYEVWDRKSRKIYFLAEELRDKTLREVSDELKLKGFYPTPGPVMLVRKPRDLQPTPLYNYYQRQAEQLNRINARLERVISAIRVRGVFNRIIGTDVAKVLDPNTPENALLPSENPVDMTNGGFEKYIWFLPFDKMVVVAQQLYQAQQQVLQVIYQITGLADIIRGASAASESATAQSIKDKWGGLRLKRMQSIIEMYARDLLRIAVDLVFQNLPPMELEKMSGVKLPMLAEKQQAMLAYQQKVLLAQQQPPQPPQPGQPPQPPKQPPPPPNLPPAWEELIEAVKSGTVGLLIDIETNSTLTDDAKIDQAEVGEMLGPFSQLVQALGPVASMGPTGLNAAKSLMTAVLKRYKLGREVEKAFEGIQPPPPPPGPNEDPAKQMELQQKQKELQAKMKELELKEATMVQKSELERQQHQMKMVELERTAQLSQAQHDVAMLQLRQKAIIASQPPPPPAGRRQPS